MAFDSSNKKMENSQNHVCQLYKYDREFFLVTKNTPQYFVDNFIASEIDDHEVAWLNFHSIVNSQEISHLCSNLKVDKLVVEDVYQEKKRPKVEEYDNHIFFSVRSALPPEHNSTHLRQEQISFIFGKNYLISLQQKKSDHFTEVRERIEMNKGKIRSKEADFLLFRMLEAIIENYYEVLTDISDKANQLEKKVMHNPTAETLKQIEREKQRLAELRKIVLPMKDVTNQIQKSQHALFLKSNSYYFDDLREYCAGVIEEIDVNKQALEGLTNLYYAVQGQKMNEIMKVLTIISAIFIPLTFIAGIYGMNFEVMPELRNPNGYFYTLIAMFAIAVFMFYIFLKRGWLKRK